jgi:hypothetical protein
LNRRQDENDRLGRRDRLTGTTTPESLEEKGSQYDHVQPIGLIQIVDLFEELPQDIDSKKLEIKSGRSAAW